MKILIQFIHYSMFQFLENLTRDFSILSIYKKSRRKEKKTTRIQLAKNHVYAKNEGWFQDFKLQNFCEMLFWKVNYYNPKLCREKLVLLYSYVIVTKDFSRHFITGITISNAFFKSWFDEIYDIKSLRMLFPAHKKAKSIKQSEYHYELCKLCICEVWQVYDIKIHDLFIDMICKKAAL